jgi:sugar phosphate permease
VLNTERAVAVASAAAASTRTRRWMLALFSLMYLICYLDRGIIFLAQPEIRDALGLSLGQMGLGDRSPPRVFSAVGSKDRRP